MRKLFERNVLSLTFIGIAMLIFEVLNSGYYIGLIGAGLILMIISIFSHHSLVSLILNTIGLILFLTVLLMTKSIWYFIIIALIIVLLSRRSTGWRLWTTENQSLHPFRDAPTMYYQGISIIQPQSKQQTLLSQQPITHIYNRKQTEFPFSDINLVYLGGNNVLDLGQTNLPRGESIVLVRKVFGTLRIVVPSDVGLSINFSAISASLVFDRQHYDLTSENIRWQSPNYDQYERQIKLVISTVIGDVEVFYV